MTSTQCFPREDNMPGGKLLRGEAPAARGASDGFDEAGDDEIPF